MQRARGGGGGGGGMMVAIRVARQFSLELLRTCDSKRHLSKGYNAANTQGGGGWGMIRIIAAASWRAHTGSRNDERG